MSGQWASRDYHLLAPKAEAGGFNYLAHPLLEIAQQVYT